MDVLGGQPDPLFLHVGQASSSSGYPMPTLKLKSIHQQDMGYIMSSPERQGSHVDPMI